MVVIHPCFYNATLANKAIQTGQVADWVMMTRLAILNVQEVPNVEVIKRLLNTLLAVLAKMIPTQMENRLEEPTLDMTTTMEWVREGRKIRRKGKSIRNGQVYWMFID